MFQLTIHTFIQSQINSLMNTDKMKWLKGLVLVVCFTHGEQTSIANERRLHNDLLEHYENYLRPVWNTKETVRVKFGISIVQLIEMNLNVESMAILGWIKMSWKDLQFQWRPVEYEGIEMTRLPPHKIWKPDVMLFNSVHNLTDLHLHSEESLAHIANNGDVFWTFPIILNSSCSFDLRYFPFDTQRCSLKFQSWTYDGFQVDIVFYEKLEAFETKDFIPNNEWGLVGNTGVKNDKYYPCCEAPYPDITFTLEFKRHTTYLTAIFVFPVVLLCFLTPFTFLTSHDSEQKLALGGTVIVCLMILIHTFQQLSAATRHTSTPFILIFYTDTLLLVTLSLVLNILIGNLASDPNTNRHPPRFFRKLFIDWLGKVCCIRRNIDEQEDSALSSGYVSNENIIEEVKATSHRKRKGDWYLIATVIDRLLFVIFLIIVVILVLLYSF